MASRDIQWWWQSSESFSDILLCFFWRQPGGAGKSGGHLETIVRLPGGRWWQQSVMHSSVTNRFVFWFVDGKIYALIPSLYWHHFINFCWLWIYQRGPVAQKCVIFFFSYSFWVSCCCSSIASSEQLLIWLLKKMEATNCPDSDVNHCWLGAASETINNHLQASECHADWQNLFVLFLFCVCYFLTSPHFRHT